jgi:hypothetical protein
MLTSAYLMPEGTRGRIRISFCVVKLFCSGSRTVANDIGYVQMFENHKAIISQRRHYGVDADTTEEKPWTLPSMGHWRSKPPQVLWVDK